jgi:hypothetical protein
MTANEHEHEREEGEHEHEREEGEHEHEREGERESDARPGAPGEALAAGQFDALVEAAPSGVDLDGLRVTGEGPYDCAVAGEEHRDLSRAALRDVLARHPAYVSNWYFWTHEVDFAGSDRIGAGRHYRAFCRWLEAAPHPDAPAWEETRDVPARYAALRGEEAGSGDDASRGGGGDGEGVVREWGQLRVVTRLDPDGAPGRRRYELRHVDDADAEPAALEAYADPLAARGIGRTDERGRYRPLRTAPSLPGGWRFASLGPREVAEAVETFYPATVPNWHLERAGELDVTHWRETAERQTGIYDVVEELSPAAVDWVAEACCVDSQCTKRREWQYDEDRELSTDGGAGAFPCREPCSLVVAAARKWTTLEREETRTYEFELTPSEKEQVEELIESVADGRVDEIREADVYEGANRYRARFLRAKRFDDEGNLSGTPTHDDADHGADADGH